jgi:hypothetical protein
MISDLERLKKKMQEKPWLYEEEEHAVLNLAEEAIQILRNLVKLNAADDYSGKPAVVQIEEWLKEHEG